MTDRSDLYMGPTALLVGFSFGPCCATICGLLFGFRYGPIVYRLGHQVFILARGVRLSLGSPKKSTHQRWVFFFGLLQTEANSVE